jgi:xylan 1,4-beta-xylosidase
VGSTDFHTEDAQGKPFTTDISTRCSTRISNAARPYAQIGFMPRRFRPPIPIAMSGGPACRMTASHGLTYPPKDYAKWGELAYQWTKHCVERYGKAEVETWYWETGMRRTSVTGADAAGISEAPRLH